MRALRGPPPREGFVADVLAALANDADRPIALICARGHRSAYARQLLLASGFSRVHDISEGMVGGVGIEVERGAADLARELLDGAELAPTADAELGPEPENERDELDRLRRRKRWFGWATFALLAAPAALLAALAAPLLGRRRKS